MQSNPRVLLLGTCGIDKRSVAQNLADYAKRHFSQQISIIDFEHEFLSKEAAFASFLLSDPEVQTKQWLAAWKRLAAHLSSNTSACMILMHSALVHGFYGARSVIQVDEVLKIKPTSIITLIDNVYDMWWRTERGARGEPLRGRPSLEQLIMARRVEQLVGDQLLLNSMPPKAEEAGKGDGDSQHVIDKHIVLSVHHPCQVAARLLFRNPQIVYLSFPISEPRRLLEDGDASGIDRINEFHAQVLEFQTRNPDVVFISPLAIDELPLRVTFVNCLKEILMRNDHKQVIRVLEKGDLYETLQFDRTNSIWAPARFWGDEDCLNAPVPSVEHQVPFNLGQVRDASGAIFTDVAWRDYRLVRQSNALAVFNPVFGNGRLAKGVRNEIHYAGPANISAYFFQDQSLDPAGIAREELEPEPGTMGGDPAVQHVVPCNSVQELLEKASTPLG